MPTGQEIIAIIVPILIGLLIIVVFAALGMAIFKRLATTKNPNEQAILNALLPHVYRSILAGEQIARMAMITTSQYLDGLDKKHIADSAYALIPDTVYIGGKVVPVTIVKQIVTKESFEAFVKDRYDEAKAFIVRNQAYLRDQVDAFVPDEYEKAVGLKG